MTPAQWTDITTLLIVTALVAPIALLLLWAVLIKRPSPSGAARRIRWSARFYWVKRWMGLLASIAWVYLAAWLFPSNTAHPLLWLDHFWPMVVGSLGCVTLGPSLIVLFLLQLHPTVEFDVDEVSLKMEGKGHGSIHVRPKGARGAVRRELRDLQNSARPVVKFVRKYGGTLIGAGVLVVDATSPDIAEEMLADEQHVVETLERLVPGWEVTIATPVPVSDKLRWLISRTRRGAEAGRFFRGVRLTWRGTVIERPRRRRAGSA